MTNKYDFKADLERGKAGEQQLCALWPSLFSPLTKDTRKYDVMYLKRRGCEVKTDSYRHDHTDNFFMESRSHGKPGGPWRAKRDRVSSFVYWFPKPTPKAYLFTDVRELCLALDSMLPELQCRTIRNKHWSATGYLVPRDELVSKLSSVEVLTLTQS